MRFWPRSSPEGHREVSEEEARRIKREGRPPQPTNPFAVGYDQGVKHGKGRSRDALEQSLRFFEGRRIDCQRRDSESGALLAAGFIAALQAQLRDLPESQGPTGVVGEPDEWLGGPTGPVPIIEHLESKGKPDEIRTGYGTTTSLGSTGGVPRFVGFRDGEWYAFRLYRLVDDEQARDRRIAERTARSHAITRYPGRPLRDGLPLDQAVSGVDVVEFYAIATADPSTGFLEIREIPDPWVCAVCEKSYEDGAHTEFGFSGLSAHDYVARGAPAKEPKS